MDAPKCKKCGNRHWGTVCAADAGTKIDTVLIDEKFDRNAYQRAYMKKWRAKKKEKKHEKTNPR